MLFISKQKDNSFMQETYPTMGNGHPFLIITKQTPLPNQEGYISQPRWNVLSSSVGLNPENLHQSPVKYEYKYFL
jgi:hypothetical protein